MIQFDQVGHLFGVPPSNESAVGPGKATKSCKMKEKNGMGSNANPVKTSAETMLVYGGQLIAFYIGDHQEADFLARAGVLVIRWAQRGSQFSDATHCEQIVAVHKDGSVDIGSATLRQDHPETGQTGVRTKRRVKLNEAHWRIYWCPTIENPVGVRLFDPEFARDLLQRQDGKGYDLVGAVGSAVLRLSHAVSRWFCSEIVAACAGFLEAWMYTPARLEAAVAGYGQEIAIEFFEKAKAAP